MHLGGGAATMLQDMLTPQLSLLPPGELVAAETMMQRRQWRFLTTLRRQLLRVQRGEVPTLKRMLALLLLLSCLPWIPRQQLRRLLECLG
jgi:hypothetical protein